MAAVTFPINNVHINAGTRTFGPFTVPAGHETYSFGLDVSAWLPTDAVTIDAQWSQDGGNTWVTGGAETFTGGTHLDRHGNVTTVGWDASFPPDLGQGLQCRPQVTVPSAGNISGFVRLN